MNKIDFSKYTIRCSFLPTLMVSPRSKGEILSETAKSGLRELWIKEVFNRERFDTSSKYTEKGIMVEPDSMDLVKKVKKEAYFKNSKRFTNEYINGEPDIVISANTENAKIKDIKSSWDIWTFSNVDEDSALKSYYYQMLGYMWLTGAKEAELLYCLVNTPDEIVANELYKLSFRYPEINESDEKTEKFKRNYIFDDIPLKLRVKSFVVPYNSDDVESIKVKIEAAREYLKSISL